MIRAPQTAKRNTLKFSLERIIGNGSFGTVYEARIIETGEIVAIKKVLQDRRFKVGCYCVLEDAALRWRCPCMPFPPSRRAAVWGCVCGCTLPAGVRVACASPSPSSCPLLCASSQNRELQIMKTLSHPNVVQLKHCFFTTEADVRVPSLIPPACVCLLRVPVPVCICPCVPVPVFAPLCFFVGIVLDCVVFCVIVCLFVAQRAVLEPGVGVHPRDVLSSPALLLPRKEVHATHHHKGAPLPLFACL